MATSTKNTGRDSDKFMLRFPDGMREHIAQAASNNGRTMNSEIVARLQGSFDFMASLPPVVREVVAEKLATSKDGCTANEVLTNLVLAGQSNGGQVLNIRIAPGMTLKEVRDALSAMAEVVPNATSVVVERE